ncbi:hypothetical protein KP509_33G065500 [Ceratopteris richardii]|nr:hypothetical protein KP509_33G065500 [Ceratopteris richardii]
MKSVLERYYKAQGDAESADNVSSAENIEIDRITLFTEKLKALQRNVIGDDLERLSLRDLIHLEQQIHESLGRIRAKKEEMILDQLEDFKKKVTDARKTTNANSSLLDKLLDFCSSDMTSSHNFVDCEPLLISEAPQADASLAGRAATSEQSTDVRECSPPAKRLRITEDLNHSPVCME